MRQDQRITVKEKEKLSLDSPWKITANMVVMQLV